MRLFANSKLMAIVVVMLIIAFMGMGYAKLDNQIKEGHAIQAIQDRTATLDSL